MRNKKRILWILIVAVTMLGVIFGEGTPLTYVYGGDTEAYYLNFHHHIGVAPGYPLFIHILQLIFGDNLYLHMTAGFYVFFFLFYSLFLFSGSYIQ